MCKKKKKQKRRSHQQQLWRLFWTLTLKNAIKCSHWCSHYCYTFCPTPSNQLTPSALLHIFPRIGECLLQHRTRQTSQTVCASCGRELIRHMHTHTANSKLIATIISSAWLRSVNHAKSAAVAAIDAFSTIRID